MLKSGMGGAASEVAGKERHGLKERSVKQELEMEPELELDPELDLDPVIARTFQYHWQHFFLADTLTYAPDNPVLAYYVKENNYMGAKPDVGLSKTIALIRSCPASSSRMR